MPRRRPDIFIWFTALHSHLLEVVMILAGRRTPRLRGGMISTGTTTYDVTATASTTVYAELASSSNGGQGPWSSYANCTVP